MTRILDINNISRRKLLMTAAIAVPGAALAGLGARAAQVSQVSVKYQTSAKDGHSCSNCKLFAPPSSCKIVAGTVSPGGWCELWNDRPGTN
ncbi:MAG: high-potential iron-sulfur protein [Hyphomicrobiales bacterium]|nr:high-potential iron-sulfur protein [Hyphomicrobiales bacterium]